MSAPPYDLPQTVRSLGAAWRAFFWEPIDPRPCAWIRIGYAALILINLAVWYPDLTQWFGPGGVLPLHDAEFLRAEARWTLFNWLPQSDAALHTMFWIFVIQTLCLLVGLASRFNLACVLVWLVTFHHRNPVILDSEDTLLRVLGFYLLVMPLARVWSVDRWLWHRHAPPGEVRVPPLGLRLLQIQMCVVFVTAALHKLPGKAWQEGTTLYYVARLDDYFGRFPTPAFLWETPWIVRPLTWSVLVVELAVPVLIWFKQTRRFSLVLLFFFHLGNEYTMNLFLFHWVMLLGWSAFVLPEDWQWLRWRPRWATSPALKHP